MALLFDSYVTDILVTLATLAFVFYKYFTATNSYWEDRGVPYKKPTLFFGSVKDQTLGRKSFHESVTDIYNEAPDSGVVGYFEFRKPALMIRDPALVEKVLIKDFTSFHDRGITADLDNDPLSVNLFTSEGSYWRNLRYKLTPTFTTGKLKSMVEQMSNCANNLVKYMEKQKRTNSDISFEGKQLIHQFSVDVIASCAFGIEFSKETEQGRLFRKMVEESFAKSKIAFLRIIVVNAFPLLARLLALKRFPAKATNYFLNITKETIKFRRTNGVKRNDFFQLMMALQEQERNKEVKDNACDGSTMEEDAELNQLENAPIIDNNASTTKIFTDECLAAQSFTFLTAGSETVAYVASYCLYALATNRHVQERLQKEVDAVLKKHNGKLTYEALKEMKYLDQVINETHRMYPTVSFLFRKCNKPFFVPDTKCTVEPGTVINIPVYCLQHDEKYFPDPYTFDPERFAEGKTIQKCTFLPFGDGPRICIGMRFAHLEIKLCIASIVSTFNVSVNKKTIQPFQYKPLSFFMAPKGGLWFDFEKRAKA